MINVVIDCITQEVKIEGYRPIPIITLNDPLEIINLIKKILDQAYISGERICLECRDKAGYYHEINRWP